MNVIIIEDEKPAAQKLQALLAKYDSNIRVLAQLGSINASLEWFRSNEGISPSVVFMDIQLSDGLSFDLFKEIKINAPIIFTTAFDEYAIDAFKVNGIDYLLKPLTYTALSAAMKKLDTLSGILHKPDVLEQVSSQITTKRYKDRFMVKKGTKIQVLESHDIAYCRADGRTLYVHTNDNNKFILDFSLSDLAEQLDPSHFYRVNRSYVVNLAAIESVSMYSNSRLKVNTNPVNSEDIIVSREKVSDFKNWWSGE